MAIQFNDLQLNEQWLKAVQRIGIEKPTPIQQKAIPILLEGRDLIAQSQTGTGKTFAFLLPILQRIDSRIKHVQAVVIVPTRELGIQISREMDALTEGSEIISQPLIGGAALKRQVEKLKLHPHVIVGTPGRIHELIQMRKLKMHEVRTIVVDEADQVFALGSMNEVEQVIKSTMRDRQLAFFSATIPKALDDVASRWMKDPLRLNISTEQIAAAGLSQDKVEHMYFVCEERDKIDLLRRLVRNLNPSSAIVFVNDTESIAEVVAKLQYANLAVEAIYGDQGKEERNRVLSGFRSGKFTLLVATDVAARGLDFKDLTHVFQFDPAVDADHYIHRAGRTGRMGRSGTVVNIVTDKQIFIMDKFARALEIDLKPMKLVYGQLYGINDKVREPRNKKTIGGKSRSGGRNR